MSVWIPNVVKLYSKLQPPALLKMSSSMDFFHGRCQTLTFSMIDLKILNCELIENLLHKNAFHNVFQNKSLEYFNFTEPMCKESAA